MAKISATWQKAFEAEILQRSSQVISVVQEGAYIFGGELRPREPRDNDVHVLSLADPMLSVHSTLSPSPPPRVGSAATTIQGKIYLFSGRGGVAMAPIEENGSIWEFDPSTATWSLIEPSEASTSARYPSARSYHCIASDGNDTLYIHAGCPEKGRLSDLWSFSLSTRKWTPLAAAPDPPRGGASIAFAGGLLYRLNGFDGKTELGGSLDVYAPEQNQWSSITYTPDGETGPGPRSVSALLPAHVGGKSSLVTLFGERDPSALGHQGAGKMLSDVWVFDLDSQTWAEAEVHGDILPAARGWFGADTVGDQTKILVQGGLGESNERLGDAWLLSF